MSHATGNIIIAIALGLVTLVLFAGLVNMMRGGSSNTSQRLMRWRVGLQFVDHRGGHAGRSTSAAEPDGRSQPHLHADRRRRHDRARQRRAPPQVGRADRGLWHGRRDQRRDRPGAALAPAARGGRPSTPCWRASRTTSSTSARTSHAAAAGEAEGPALRIVPAQVDRLEREIDDLNARPAAAAQLRAAGRHGDRGGAASGPHGVPPSRAAHGRTEGGPRRGGQPGRRSPTSTVCRTSCSSPRATATTAGRRRALGAGSEPVRSARAVRSSGPQGRGACRPCRPVRRKRSRAR